MNYLLDTNHASALYFRRAVTIGWHTRIGNRRLLLCTPSVGELWFMIENSRLVAENRPKLESFIVGSPIVSFGMKAVQTYGRIAAQTRRAGKSVSQIDMQIAALAMVHNLTVLTDDADFSYIDGVRTENWLR